jgi:hypothetical protein
MKRRLLALAILLLGAAGCGRPGYDRYIPAEATARQALEAALGAWQEGRPPGRIDGFAAPIEVVDTHRRPGQRLVAFAVLGEVPGSAPRCFAVRLTFDNPGEQQKVRFVVVGKEPLWVLRQDDYDMMAHWEHPMDGDAAKAAPKK